MVGSVLGQFRLPLLIGALESAPVAAASNLAISSLGAATGALAHAREGRVELRLLLTIGLPSTLAAYASARMVPQVDVWWLEALIGATLVLSAAALAHRAWRLHSEAIAPSAPAGDADPVRESPEPHSPEPAPADTYHGEPARALSPALLTLEVLTGAVIGTLSGIVGLLLGSLRLPAMLRLGIPPLQAVGTNMAIGFFTGVAGTLGAVSGGRVSWLALSTVGAVTFFAAWLGARQTKSLPSARHFTLIAIMLLAVGAWMIGRALLTR